MIQMKVSNKNPCYILCMKRAFNTYNLTSSRYFLTAYNSKPSPQSKAQLSLYEEVVTVKPVQDSKIRANIEKYDCE